MARAVEITRKGTKSGPSSRRIRNARPKVSPAPGITTARHIFFYLFRRGVPSGVDCCENRTLPPRLGTPLTSSIINWHKRVSRGRTFNSNGPWLTISRVILPLNPA